MSNGRPTNRTLQIVLFVSLALNLFFVGNLAVHWLGIRWHQPPYGPTAIVERLISRLGDKDAAVLRSAFQSNQAKIESAFGELRQAHRAARAKLVAEPFDRAGFTTAIAEMNAKRQAFDRAVEEVIIGSAGNLSSEGRRKLFPGAGQRQAKGRQ